MTKKIQATPALHVYCGENLWQQCCKLQEDLRLEPITLDLVALASRTGTVYIGHASDRTWDVPEFQVKDTLAALRRTVQKRLTLHLFTNSPLILTCINNCFWEHKINGLPEKFYYAYTYPQIQPEWVTAVWHNKKGEHTNLMQDGFIDCTLVASAGNDMIHDQILFQANWGRQ